MSRVKNFILKKIDCVGEYDTLNNTDIQSDDEDEIIFFHEN